MYLDKREGWGKWSKLFYLLYARSVVLVLVLVLLWFGLAFWSGFPGSPPGGSGLLGDSLVISTSQVPLVCDYLGPVTL